MTILTGIHKDVNFSLKKEFVRHGTPVDRSEWQGLRDDRPQMKTVELYDVAIDMDVPDTVEEWQEFCQPNLPWAENHFQERILGEPLNPGKQYKNWPWYEGGVEEHKQTGRFSHSYMERYWPKLSNLSAYYEPAPYASSFESTPRQGIRFEYGDLADLIWLLQERPMTRQAYLPIWFPEDLTASRIGERVPCSLGYLFQYNGESKVWDCWYYMRSCDFLRYLWDDLYLTGRLLQWVGQATDYPIGQVHAKIANLHIFQAEYAKIEQEYGVELGQRLSNAF